MQDPIGGFQRIRDLYITYLETAFRIRDTAITAERRAMLERAQTFCTEPLVEPLPQYETVDFAFEDLANPSAKPLFERYGASRGTILADLAHGRSGPGYRCFRVRPRSSPHQGQARAPVCWIHRRTTGLPAAEGPSAEHRSAGRRFRRALLDGAVWLLWSVAPVRCRSCWRERRVWVL